MTHTPLLTRLHRALHLARLANRRTGPPADELVEMARARRLDRRRFLQMAGGSALALAGAPLLRADAPPIVGAPRVAIVGGGIAGLNAAHVLRRAGVRATVYEAQRRVGGRMFSAAGLFGRELVTELGGEFIDTSHGELHALIEEFGLELIDTASDEIHDEVCLFGGHRRSELEMVEAFRPLADRIAADAAGLGETISFQDPGGAWVLDHTSLEAYFDRIGASGWIRDLLAAAYVAEYGLECGEQSCLNFLCMISTDLGEGLALLGDSDERFKVRGGNDQIPQALAHRLAGQVRLDHRLEAIRARGDGFTLTFAAAQGPTRDIEADAVILTLPFTVLREVDLRIDLPEVKRRAIAELGYGTNAKLMLGFDRRVWRDQGLTGAALSDTRAASVWDSSRMQGGEAGALTCYSGGAAGVAVGEDSASMQAERVLSSLEAMFPGAASAHTRRSSRMHWPSFAWTRGSYSAYRPGQWTGIGGAEILPVGQLHFAGEHCSGEFQGFMNGAAQTGRMAAEAILAQLGVPV